LSLAAPFGMTGTTGATGAIGLFAAGCEGATRAAGGFGGILCDGGNMKTLGRSNGERFTGGW